MADEHPRDHYDKLAYDHERAPLDYEKRAYYQGWLGRFRRLRERRAVFHGTQQFSRECTVLDCPCGNGRWFRVLGMRASRIVARDVAAAMVAAARKRQVPGTDLDVQLGDAEALDLPDDAVDHVFSYALMKHLPPRLQRSVLQEFARVSTGRIAVSFGLLTPLSYPLWKLRGAQGYPIWPAAVHRWARDAGLVVGAVYKVGVPALGMETLLVFERAEVAALG